MFKNGFVFDFGLVLFEMFIMVDVFSNFFVGFFFCGGNSRVTLFVIVSIRFFKLFIIFNIVCMLFFVVFVFFIFVIFFSFGSFLCR